MDWDKTIKVAPSILSADFGRLNEEVASVESASDIVHVDVMDGQFVENISFGAPVYRCLKTNLPLDVHLMIVNPAKWLGDFAAAGKKVGVDSRLIVHSEACGRGDAYENQWGSEDNLREVLEKIKALGCGAGVALRPKSPVSSIADLLDLIDVVLIMTVEPGFSGQKFMEDQMPKVKELREKHSYSGDICVDGGVNDVTGAMSKKAGANVMAAASFIFKAEDRLAAIEKLKTL